MSENISLWVAIVGGIVTIIGSIAGAVIFVNSTIKEKITEAVAAFAENQRLKDAGCETHRENITDEVQILTNKNILLDGELRSPTGIYPKILVIESQINTLKEEISYIKQQVRKDIG